MIKKLVRTPQCPKGVLEQGVSAFGESSGRRVQSVDGPLVRGESGPGAGLNRQGVSRRVLALVAEIGLYSMVVVAETHLTVALRELPAPGCLHCATEWITRKGGVRPDSSLDICA